MTPGGGGLARRGSQSQCAGGNGGCGDVAHVADGERTRSSLRHGCLVGRPQPGCGGTDETDSPPVFKRNYGFATLGFTRSIANQP